MHSPRFGRFVVRCFFAGGLASFFFARAELAPPVSASAGIEASVRLLAPRDAVIEWREATADAAVQVAGHVVEYINRPEDEWVILGFFPRGHSRFVHPRLAPATPYAYRVRAFYGPASETVSVTVAEGLSDEAYVAAYALPENYSWAAPTRTLVPDAGVRAGESGSVRTQSAAPARLAAEVIRSTVSGFRLTWADRSDDEEGFLLERVVSDTEFVVCAVVGPDINTFGWALEPPDRVAAFRVRAYRFSPASAVVGIVTGAGAEE